jgi:CAAX protease family protein
VRKSRLLAAAVAYAVLLAIFWTLSRHSSAATWFGSAFPRAFACLSLLFAPLWFFGFGAAEPLRTYSDQLRILAAAALAIPYFVFALGTPLFHWRAAVIVIALPVLLAAFLGLPRLPQSLTARDCAALAIIAATHFLHWLHIAWPDPRLSLLTKLFLADVVLYCFLVIRKLDRTGYSLVPDVSALSVGLREWVFYFPFAFGIGELTGFIHFHHGWPGVATLFTTLVVTCCFVALPEELFFRAILQNLIETRVGRSAALATAAVLFGLSHFNHGSAFSWRYVLLAVMAGAFYGRAWRADRRVLASIITHTAVDVVWVLWFR